MKPQRRLLAVVCTEINDLAERWHARIRDLDDGRDVTPELTDIEEQLERLFAEKRWLKAGGVVISSKVVGEIERRLRLSLHKYRDYGLPQPEPYGWAKLAEQLEGA